VVQLSIDEIKAVHELWHMGEYFVEIEDMTELFL
jgi:hypothetical protein